MNKNLKRCFWVDLNNDLYIDYHDNDWGVPVYDDRLLFEMLILEGAQAGLSWSTILKKRDNYKKAFDNFFPDIVAKYDDKKIEELLNNKGIVRNRRKINAAINNAKVFLEIQKDFGSFSKYIWAFVGGKTIHNSYSNYKDVPTKTELSDLISKDLKKRGMSFVGSTIIYSYIQAIGMVNDHEMGCFRYNEIKRVK